MVCRNSSAVCWELSHSLAVVLWGRNLIVTGTEEGGWILHQVSEGHVKVLVIVEQDKNDYAEYCNKIVPQYLLFLVCFNNQQNYFNSKIV